MCLAYSISGLFTACLDSEYSYSLFSCLEPFPDFQPGEYGTGHNCRFRYKGVDPELLPPLLGIAPERTVIFSMLLFLVTILLPGPASAFFQYSGK